MIKNDPSKSDPRTDLLRSAIEHRSDTGVKAGVTEPDGARSATGDIPPARSGAEAYHRRTRSNIEESLRRSIVVDGYPPTAARGSAEIGTVTWYTEHAAISSDYAAVGAKGTATDQNGTTAARPHIEASPALAIGRDSAVNTDMPPGLNQDGAAAVTARAVVTSAAAAAGQLGSAGRAIDRTNPWSPNWKKTLPCLPMPW